MFVKLQVLNVCQKTEACELDYMGQEHLDKYKGAVPCEDFHVRQSNLNLILAQIGSQ